MENLIKTELIEDFLKEKEWSKTKFCRQCKISYKTFQKIMSNDYNFDVRALFRVCKIIGVEVYKIFK